MTDMAKPEDPVLAPTFHEIFCCIRRREEKRLGLGVYKGSQYSPAGGPAGEVIGDLLRAIQSEEVSLLRHLTGLLDKVRLALRVLGKDSSSVDLIRRFKPFQVAEWILAPSGVRPSYSYGIVSHQTPGTEREDGSIYDVAFAVSDASSTWRILDIVCDLLQYWEIVLREQTGLECTDFCQGARRSLLGRVQMTLFHDALSGEALPAKGSGPSRTVEAMAADIRRRLERIVAHIQEHEAKRVRFERFTARDEEPSAPAHEDLMQLERLYFDDATFLLSELVHLVDNVGKWLLADRKTKQELSVIEDLKPFRVASCYVNTQKHGVRGRNKATAVEDIVVHFLAPSGRASAKEDFRIVDAVTLINYEGDAWQATSLADDLCQLWELFLRNHTSVNTREFRVELAKLLLKRKELSVYSTRLPDGIKPYLQEWADDRKHLDV